MHVSLLGSYRPGAPLLPSPAPRRHPSRVTDTPSGGRARDHLLVAVAAGTGLRVHELVALDWGQLVSEGGAVRHRVHLRAEDTTGNVDRTVHPTSASAMGSCEWPHTRT